MDVGVFVGVYRSVGMLGCMWVLGGCLLRVSVGSCLCGNIGVYAF